MTSLSSRWQDLQRRTRAGKISLETAALLVGTLFFIIGFLISIILFWGRELEISG